jgi:hypothetical protein
MAPLTTAPTARVTDRRGGSINLQRVDTAHGRAVGGSDRDTWNNLLLSQTLYTYWVPGDGLTPEEHQTMAEAAAIALAAFKPANPVEGMLAAQAVAQHFASMECARRAMIAGQPLETAQTYRKASANAARTCIELVGAIDRHRGKHRQQTVRVERVTVEAGAQAVVGVVQTGGAGGAPIGTEGQAHGYSAAEGDGASCAGLGVPPVRRKDPARHPVPVSRDQG